jgi:hypothetical protein
MDVLLTYEPFLYVHIRVTDLKMYVELDRTVMKLNVTYLKNVKPTRLMIFVQVALKCFQIKPFSFFGTLLRRVAKIIFMIIE